MTRMFRFVAMICLATFWPLLALAVDTRDTRLLSNPAISAQSIAFVYDGGLWVANRDGTGARRLTTRESIEIDGILTPDSNPVFSPDGKWLAYSADYDGNVDVYLIPATGGAPRRLTWHPDPDNVIGFTPDGQSVIFSSRRSTHTGMLIQLFSISIEGGYESQIPVPNGSKGSFSPDGKYLAYVPQIERFTQWKNYRGGTASRIWLYRLKDKSVVQIPQPAGRCNDTDPLWVNANSIYFRSDRAGEFNLFVYDVGSGAVRQLTRHADFPVLSAAAGGGAILYEQGGRLHLFDLASETAKPLVVPVSAELRETRPRYVQGSRYIRDVAPSPSGARVAFEFRGEIVTVPESKGDSRNETATPAVHERSPVWSPDGQSLAYFSDKSGEYELHVRRRGNEPAVRRYKLDGAGVYQAPKWSPDGKRVCYIDNSLTVFWIDLDSGKVKKVGQPSVYGPPEMALPTANWSPDSQWLAYTLHSPAYMRVLHLYSVAEDKSFTLSDGLTDVAEPVFDAGGKYLYFLASTDAGPLRDWFAQSNIEMRTTSTIHAAMLRKDLPSPVTKESDEEPSPSLPASSQPKAEAGPEEAAAATKPADVPFRIDLEGLDQRIVMIDLPPREYVRLQAGDAGTFYVLDRGLEGAKTNPVGTLKQYSVAKRSTETILEGISDFWLCENRKKILYRTGVPSSDLFASPSPQSLSFGIIPASGKATVNQGRLPIEAIEVRIDPVAEWKQVFDEVWRINRDYFYATNFHGADWPRMKEKYSAFLPHLATRGDLNRLIQWMCSELAVGHHFVAGGDRLEQVKPVTGGLLGADFEVVDGRYRIRKIYSGENWSRDLRAPLTEPGVAVQAGDYLLAVNGRDLQLPTNLHSLFEGTAGKQVRLRVGPAADGSGSREVTVVPIPNEMPLRHRDWIERNRRRVLEATGNRVAYVYVPNTGDSGHAEFKRYFFPQAQLDGIIIDDRHNGGGSVADYYIDLLRRPVISYWAMRHGEDLKSPLASIQGPKAMLIDETASSGGDLLPWMFRKFKLGPLVGKRTWGGLVGMLGYHVLMDGGLVTAPDLAIWTEDGWVVENEGVPPDIDVEQSPAEVLAGRDPQLEQAIEYVLGELKKNPPAKPKRPPFPVRSRPKP